MSILFSILFMAACLTGFTFNCMAQDDDGTSMIEFQETEVVEEDADAPVLTVVQGIVEVKKGKDGKASEVNIKDTRIDPPDVYKVKLDANAQKLAAQMAGKKANIEGILTTSGKVKTVEVKKFSPAPERPRFEDFDVEGADFGGGDAE